ncbi:MAG: hypothetical protein WCP21_23450, partial [Armatimonadota bacterium]
SGGILHGGLALQGGRGYLFTAPPGGGKSTALSRLPAPWEVLSDDAALVWFDAEGHPWASPLPTWSALLGRGSMLSADHIPRATEKVSIAGALLLQKALSERIVALSPIDAAPPLYRALCEHPAMLGQRRLCKAALFHCACELARKAPVWQLELRKDGAFWETLAEVV